MTYNGWETPQKIPTPADAFLVPFFEHAPSV